MNEQEKNSIRFRLLISLLNGVNSILSVLCVADYFTFRMLKLLTSATDSQSSMATYTGQYHFREREKERERYFELQCH